MILLALNNENTNQLIKFNGTSNNGQQTATRKTNKIKTKIEEN